MISNEKEQGTLESLLLTPLSNLKIMMVKRQLFCVFWFGVLLISLPYFFALTYGTQLLPTVFALILILGTLLVLGFSLFSFPAFQHGFHQRKMQPCFPSLFF